MSIAVVDGAPYYLIEVGKELREQMFARKEDSNIATFSGAPGFLAETATRHFDVARLRQEIS